MEDNRPNQDLTNQDIEFIKEKVKERPLNRRKLFKRTLLTASMAAIFGLIACVTFLVLEPVFSNLLYPEEEPQQVELKEENIEDEMRPEDMILEERQSCRPMWKKSRWKSGIIRSCTGICMRWRRHLQIIRW